MKRYCGIQRRPDHLSKDHLRTAAVQYLRDYKYFLLGIVVIVLKWLIRAANTVALMLKST